MAHDMLQDAKKTEKHVKMQFKKNGCREKIRQQTDRMYHPLRVIHSVFIFMNLNI